MTLSSWPRAVRRGAECGAAGLALPARRPARYALLWQFPPAQSIRNLQEDPRVRHLVITQDLRGWVLSASRPLTHRPTLTSRWSRSCATTPTPASATRASSAYWLERARVAQLVVAFCSPMAAGRAARAAPAWLCPSPASSVHGGAQGAGVGGMAAPSLGPLAAAGGRERPVCRANRRLPAPGTPVAPTSSPRRHLLPGQGAGSARGHAGAEVYAGGPPIPGAVA